MGKGGKFFLIVWLANADMNKDRVAIDFKHHLILLETTLASFISVFASQGGNSIDKILGPIFGPSLSPSFGPSLGSKSTIKNFKESVENGSLYRCLSQKMNSGSNWGRNSGPKFCQLNCHPDALRAKSPSLYLNFSTVFLCINHNRLVALNE